MPSRKTQLEELFESFQIIKRHLMCHKANHHHAVTPAQWPVIRILDQKKQSNVKEMAQFLGISSSAATQLIDGLVKEGYVRRKESKEDRRAMLLTLSPEAKRKMSQLKKETFKHLSQLLKALSDEELNHYLTLNQKIIQTLSPQ